MNRADTKMLLAKISNLFGRRKATEDVIDDWHAMFADVDTQDVHEALNRIFMAGDEGPSASKLMAEIRTRHPAAPAEIHPLGVDGCELCGGTGWMTVNFGGANRQAPCGYCRPDHPWHRRQPDDTEERLTVSAYEGADERINAYRRTEEEYRAVLHRQFGPRHWHGSTPPPAS